LLPFACSKAVWNIGQLAQITEKAVLLIRQVNRLSLGIFVEWIKDIQGLETGIENSW
jgi:hypothetical protein